MARHGLSPRPGRRYLFWPSWGLQSARSNHFSHQLPLTIWPTYPPYNCGLFLQQLGCNHNAYYYAKNDPFLPQWYNCWWLRDLSRNNSNCQPIHQPCHQVSICPGSSGHKGKQTTDNPGTTTWNATDWPSSSSPHTPQRVPHLAILKWRRPECTCWLMVKWYATDFYQHCARQQHSPSTWNISISDLHGPMPTPTWWVG